MKTLFILLMLATPVFAGIDFTPSYPLQELNNEVHKLDVNVSRQEAIDRMDVIIARVQEMTDEKNVQQDATKAEYQQLKAILQSDVMEELTKLREMFKRVQEESLNAKEKMAYGEGIAKMVETMKRIERSPGASFRAGSSPVRKDVFNAR